MMQSEIDRELLRQIGYDPDDPTYSVQWVSTGDVPMQFAHVVTAPVAADVKVKTVVRDVLAAVMEQEQNPDISGPVWDLVQKGTGTQEARKAAIKLAAEAIWLVLHMRTPH